MPTPQDVNAVIRSQEYFRLKRVVVSPGDIYELEESTKAIYIGPDSDISEIQVTYFNPDEPNALETAVVATNGPFVGRLDALLKTIVPSTSQIARILINPVDIVDNNYTPPSIAQRLFRVPAQIDVIAALKELPDIPSVRADKTFRFPSVPFTSNRTIPPDPDDGSTDLLVPIYGRRTVTVTAISQRNVELEFSLVTLQPGQNTVPRSIHKMKINATIPPSPQTATMVIRASDASRQGVTYDAAGNNTGFYEESDEQLGPSVTFWAGFTPVPRARGLADLLLINVKYPPDGGAVATLFMDLFIKVSDRET